MRIHQRGPNSYYTIISLPRDPITGKYPQKRISGKSKADVEAKAIRFRSRILDGSYAEPSKLTLIDYLQRDWLHSQDRNPNTQASYKNQIAHIVREIGGITLSKLRPSIIEALYRRLIQKGLSPSTVAQTHSVLRNALNDAVRLEIIETNPALAARPPRDQPREMRYWSIQQTKDMFSACHEHPDYPLWVLASSTGMRISEILGLTWEHVDFDRRTVHVEHQLAKTVNGYELRRVKAAKSRRTIPLRQHVVDALHQQRRDQLTRRMATADRWHDTEAVFDRGDGYWINRRVVTQRFDREIRVAGVVPIIRFHDLRHTAATTMLALGVPLFEVSRILGHSSINITADRYGHLAIETVQASIDRMDALDSG